MGIAMAIIFVVILGIWMVVLGSKGSDLLPFAIGSVLLFGLLESWFFVKMIKTFKKDLDQQVKLVGEAKVLSKLSDKNATKITIDDVELKELNLTKNQFDKINVGDVLYVEVSKHSKHLFRLSRNEENLK